MSKFNEYLEAAKKSKYSDSNKNTKVFNQFDKYLKFMNMKEEEYPRDLEDIEAYISLNINKITDKNIILGLIDEMVNVIGSIVQYMPNIIKKYGNTKDKIKAEEILDKAMDDEDVVSLGSETQYFIPLAQKYRKLCQGK